MSILHIAVIAEQGLPDMIIAVFAVKLSSMEEPRPKAKIFDEMTIPYSSANAILVEIESNKDMLVLWAGVIDYSFTDSSKHIDDYDTKFNPLTPRENNKI